MDYRNDRVDWIYCPGFEDRYSAFFAVYIDFICDVILPNFPLFSYRGKWCWAQVASYEGYGLDFVWLYLA